MALMSEAAFQGTRDALLEHVAVDVTLMVPLNRVLRCDALVPATRANRCR
jgi:hypothetical protein